MVSGGTATVYQVTYSTVVTTDTSRLIVTNGGAGGEVPSEQVVVAGDAFTRIGTNDAWTIKNWIIYYRNPISIIGPDGSAADNNVLPTFPDPDGPEGRWRGNNYNLEMDMWVAYGVITNIIVSTNVYSLVNSAVLQTLLDGKLGTNDPAFLGAVAHTNRTDNPHAVTPAQIGAVSNTPAGISAGGGIVTNTAINLGTNHLTVTTIKPVAGSTTAVRITKADGTTGVLTVDTTNERVGIGATSPTEKLEVSAFNSAIAFTRTLSTGSARFHYKTGASYLWSTGLRANRDDFAIFDEGTSNERLTILKSNGDTGIGTTAPAAKLHVVGSAIISSNLTVNGAININGTNLTDMIAASTNPIPAQTAAAIANATNAIVQAGWLLYDAGSNKWLRVTVSNYSYYISEVL
jgi:hypothetical protein